MSGTAELRAEAERLARRLKAAPSLFAGDMEAMVARLNAALVAAEEGSTASPAKLDTKAGGAGNDPLDKVAQALTSACAAFIDMAERFRQRNARDWAERAEQEQAKCEAALVGVAALRTALDAAVASSDWWRAECEADKRERDASRAEADGLREAMHPEILDAIADEIECFEHSARCGSLRLIAKQQRAALATQAREAGPNG